MEKKNYPFRTYVFSSLCHFQNWFFSIFRSISQPICSLKHPSTPLLILPSPTLCIDSVFLILSPFRDNLPMIWFCWQMCCFKLYIFFLTGSTTNIHGDWVSNATSPNPKKTYKTKKKTPSTGGINHSTRT